MVYSTNGSLSILRKTQQSQPLFRLQYKERNFVKKNNDKIFWHTCYFIQAVLLSLTRKGEKTKFNLSSRVRQLNLSRTGSELKGGTVEK